MKKTTAKEVLIFALSFAVPTLIFALCWANIGITYNGELTPLIYDMNVQYMPFMTSLRYVLSGENSIFFNWSVCLGGDYLSLFAYYLASPLNLLTVFWDVEQMPQAIYVITLIKIGLCGLTFQTFLRYGLAKKQSSYVNIVFASCYALMSYNVVYSMCLMWLDGVILLPLILLGVEKLFEGKKGAVYFFSIFGCFYCNFYISYMVGIFTAVYFLTCVLRYWEKGCVRQMLVKAGRFTLLTLTALGLTMPMVLPALLSLAKGKGATTVGEAASIEAYQFSFSELIGKVLPQQYDSIEYSGLPSIFCGTLIAVLCIGYFLHKGDMKEKIGMAVLLAFLFSGFLFQKMDYFLHGFQYPHCFPYRYSFTLSIGMLVCAVRCFEKLKKLKRMNWAIILASCYTIVELFLNGSFVVGGLHEEVSYFLRKSFQEIYLYEKTPIHMIHEENDEFYRIGEELTYTGSNFGLVFNYAGIDYFASFFNYPVNLFLDRMGKADTYYMTGIKGVEPFTLSYLGIKYIVSPWEISDGIYNKITQDGENSPIKTYVNENACSIGFLTDKKHHLRNAQLNHTVYENANTISTMLSGNEEKIYLDIKMNVEDKEILKEDGAYRLSLSFDTDQVGNYYLDIDGRWDKVPPKVQYGQEMPEDFQAEESNDVCREFIIELDGETVYKGGYTRQFQNGYYLGEIDETGHHEIVVFASDYLHLNSLSLYYQDKETLIQKLKSINSESVYDLCKEKNGFSCEVSAAERKSLVVSVPYDQGWTAYVDGKKTDIMPVFETFASIDVPKGEHIVEFVFLPKGFVAGCILSVISLFTIVTYFGLKRKQSVNIS